MSAIRELLEPSKIRPMSANSPSDLLVLSNEVKKSIDHSMEQFVILIHLSTFYNAVRFIALNRKMVPMLYNLGWTKLSVLISS